MSTQIELQAWEIILREEELEDLTPYTKEWMDTAEKWKESNILVEGCLTLGYETAQHYILETLRELQVEGKDIFESDEDSIIATPEILKDVILRNWSDWHEADPRWLWKEETIIDFFTLYDRAGKTIIILVY